MSEIQSYKRLPAINCWIMHILAGQYSSKENILFTIFGKVKRVRIMATIIDKREMIKTQGEENDLMEKDIESSNLIFDLDDSTGLINAIIWQVNPEKYKEYNKGDIVDIVGTVRESRETMSISIEIMRKVKEPNYILLKNAEIIKKIRFGKIELIPDTKEEVIGSDEVPFNEHFKGEGLKQADDIKEKIYSIIESHSLEGNGISFEKLKEKVQITEEDLKNVIVDLEMESRIYQSEENVYQSY